MLQSRAMNRGVSDELEVDPKGEFLFDPTLYVFHLMVAIGRLRDAQLERELKPIGVNVARHRALTVILRFGPCTMTELAEHSAVDRTTLTRTVDQLVKDGHVDRGAKPEDRRQVVLTLTDAGRVAAAAARDVVARHNRRILEGVPDETLRAMVRGQRRILANLAPTPEMLERLLTLAAPERRQG